MRVLMFDLAAYATSPGSPVELYNCLSDAAERPDICWRERDRMDEPSPSSMGMKDGPRQFDRRYTEANKDEGCFKMIVRRKLVRILMIAIRDRVCDRAIKALVKSAKGAWPGRDAWCSGL